jgi:hypothetical protein
MVLEIRGGVVPFDKGNATKGVDPRTEVRGEAGAHGVDSAHLQISYHAVFGWVSWWHLLGESKQWDWAVERGVTTRELENGISEHRAASLLESQRVGVGRVVMVGWLGGTVGDAETPSVSSDLSVTGGPEPKGYCGGATGHWNEGAPSGGAKTETLKGGVDAGDESGVGFGYNGVG